MIRKGLIAFLLMAGLLLFVGQSTLQAGQTQEAWNAWFSINKQARGTNWSGTVLLIFNNFNDSNFACPSITSADIEIYLHLKHGNNLATFHGLKQNVCVSINPDNPAIGGQGSALQDFITEVVVEGDDGLGGTCPDAGCLMSQNNATVGGDSFTSSPGPHPRYWFFADVTIAIQQ